MGTKNEALQNIIETIKFARKMKIEKIVFSEKVYSSLFMTDEDIQMLKQIYKEYSAYIYFKYPSFLQQNDISDKNYLLKMAGMQPKIVIILD